MHPHLQAADRSRSLRSRLARAALLLTLLALSPLPALADLTLVSWGGSYTRSQILAFVRPYEELSGKQIEVDEYSGGLGELRRQVQSLNFKWDVIDLELSDAIRGCEEGLLEPIPLEILAPPVGTPGSASDDFISGSLTDCGVGTVVWSTVIAYDRGAFEAAPPGSLVDFFDTERFPGPRGMRRTPRANLEWALLADGVSREQVYHVLETREGLERALRVLERIKPNLVWWQVGAEAPRLLETGKVVMTTAYNGRVEDAVNGRGRDFAIIWDRQIWNIDLLGIPRNNPRRAEALDFIRFATATEQLAEQARHIPYGPVRYSSLARLSESERANLPTESRNFANAMRINARWWAAHYTRINKRFEEWTQQPLRVPQKLPR